MQVGVYVAVPVLHGQTPACERDHLPAVSQVEVIEWCLVEPVLRVARLSTTEASKPPAPHPPTPGLLPYSVPPVSN